MKTALVVLAVALAVVSCQAGGSSGHGGYGHGSYGHGGYAYGYKYHEGYEYKSYGSGYKYYSVGGGSAHKGCHYKGVYECDKECEDPVCKQVYHACGKTKCAATEICAAGKCFDFECKEGKKCYHGVKEECAVECTEHKVCATKKVKVCDGGDKPWRKLLGGAHATATAEAYGYGAGASASAHAKAVHVHGGAVKHVVPHVIVKKDPCHFVEKVECEPEKKCEKVCKEKKGYFCTAEKCEAELAVVECGDGYCNAGDECYQPACEKKCTFHKRVCDGW